MPYKDMPWIRHDWLRLPEQDALQVGSQAWFDWLEQATAFCYQPPGKIDRFTLYKEKRRHQFYWYAYMKYDRKLHNAYGGKSQSLTAIRLLQIFETLMAKVHHQQELHHDE